MNPLLICVTAATLGIQFGWERLPDGGAEYIIQLNAMDIDALRDNQQLRSAVSSDAGEIKAFRIVAGAGKPKREPPLLKPAPPPLPIKAAPVKPAPVEPIPSAKPWLPLTLTLLGLFASLGANAFLAWIAWGFRRRCQDAFCASGEAAADGLASEK
jgi:hypothetical protein